MTCDEAREYLFAFLDGELDASLSIELQRHLEHCPECAREAEIERAIRRQLGTALGHVDAGGAEEALLRQALARIRSLDRRTRLRSPQRLIGLAAVVVLGVLTWIAWRSAGPVETNSRFTELLVSDFQHFLEKGRPLEVTSDDRRAVEAWLCEKTTLALALPPGPEARLLGGRTCLLGGKTAALAAYDIAGAPATLIVAPGNSDDLTAMDRVSHGKHTHWVDRSQGHTVVACQRNGLIYAAVSTVEEEQLLPLMARPQRDPPP